MAKQTLDYLLDKVLGGAATHMPDMFEERKKQVLAPIYFEAGAAYTTVNPSNMPSPIYSHCVPAAKPRLDRMDPQ